MVTIKKCFIVKTKFADTRILKNIAKTAILK